MNTIDPKVRVSEILKMYPKTLQIFRSFNMKCVEDNNLADKALEENLMIEQVNYIDVFLQLDKIDHNLKQKKNQIRQQNNDSHNQIKYGVCEVCGNTSNLYKVEVLFSKRDYNPQFKKTTFYECRACLKGSWSYWLLIILALLFLAVSTIPLYEWLTSSGLKSGTAWKLIGFILLIVTMFLVKIISFIFRSTFRCMNMETVKDLFNDGYSVVYVYSKVSNMLSRYIALTKYHDIVHLFGSKSYKYSEGLQIKNATSIKEDDIIWKILLYTAFIKASF